MARNTAICILVITACADIVGLGDTPLQSECVSDRDCAHEKTCVAFHCIAAVGGAGSPPGPEHTLPAARAGAPGAGGTAPSVGEAGTAGTADAAGTPGGGSKATEGGQTSGAASSGENPSPSGGVGATVDSPLASAGDAGAPHAPTEGACADLERACLTCTGSRPWAAANYGCAAACIDGDCVLPKSCNGLTARCGPNRNCCLSYPVPDGSFARGCDESCKAVCDDPHEYPATVTSFSLDAFEVTVGRFRKFVNDYDSPEKLTEAWSDHSRAREGEGEAARWPEAWNSQLPPTKDELIALVSKERCDTTWTPDESDNEALPITCVSWFLAYAFCMWDGGRLPSQLEWNYAAAGGDQQRRYPWSSSPVDSTLDPSYANYGQHEGSPARVGSTTLGVGRWGQYDLAGNVAEWVLDGWEDCYSTPDRCDDCSYFDANEPLRVIRGGAFNMDAAQIGTAARTAAGADESYPMFGFRCARDF